ncbi:uncharacterized protein KY384_009030 [Bacidia gigantensis]|uniref:uncharacterized protein n=1 Tax=Bacidia gigantensis TaxID=2732470 RepID=UPI001D04C770|nr:uncharacterized protein KY384_009030 [Bacidia gigantensis]KAG8525386.1 hypothetical protein KY384_009030 [Bacidia gigantensis]
MREPTHLSINSNEDQYNRKGSLTIKRFYLCVRNSNRLSQKTWRYVTKGVHHNIQLLSLCETPPSPTNQSQTPRPLSSTTPHYSPRANWSSSQEVCAPDSRSISSIQRNRKTCELKRNNWACQSPTCTHEKGEFGRSLQSKQSSGTKTLGDTNQLAVATNVGAIVLASKTKGFTSTKTQCVDQLAHDAPLKIRRYTKDGLNPGAMHAGNSTAINKSPVFSSIARSHFVTNMSSRSKSTTSGRLDIRPSQIFEYPNLSLSSFASQAGPTSPSHSVQISDKDNEAESDEGCTPSVKVPDTSQNLMLQAETFATPLGFHIPYDTMSAALSAPENSEQSYWQHSLYRGPNSDQQVVKVHYCKTKETMESVSQLFADEQVLGFDIEWMANSSANHGTRRNVSLIQIASEERVALFHIARFPDNDTADAFVSPTFRNIMESPDILKVGVAILGDSTRLRNFLGIHCRGLHELSFLYKIIKYHSGQLDKINRYPVSLAQQVQEHLGLPLLKDQVQTSDWSKNLDSEQTRYAASDPYACLQLFHCLEAKRLALDPVPERPAFAELKQRLLVKRLPLKRDDDDSESSDDSFVTCIEASSDEDIDSMAADFRLVDIRDSNLPLENLRVNDEHHNKASSPSKLAEMPLTKADRASNWATSYRESQPMGPQIPSANLRAYYLWHHQQLELPEIASTLRTPPLKYITVLEYVCEAVYRGSFPADPERFAHLGTHGVQPYKKYHLKMLQAARTEMERRKRTDLNTPDEELNARWWKSADE